MQFLKKFKLYAETHEGYPEVQCYWAWRHSSIKLYQYCSCISYSEEFKKECVTCGRCKWQVREPVNLSWNTLPDVKKGTERFEDCSDWWWTWDPAVAQLTSVPLLNFGYGRNGLICNLIYLGRILHYQLCIFWVLVADTSPKVLRYCGCLHPSELGHGTYYFRYV